MREDADISGPIDVRVMNEYGVDMPLWLDLDLDEDDLALSESLRSDLAAFARRWEENIDPEVFEDRWTGVPIMDTLVGWRYALRRRLDAERRRSERAESEDMLRTGEALAQRVQDELGPAFSVRYVH